MNGTAKLKRVGHTAWVAIRFVLFGCVGFYGVLFGSAMLTVSILDPADRFSISPFLSFPLVVAGIFMMLYGTGQWKRWAYLWVFASIPISLLLSLFVPGDKIAPAIVVGIAAFAANAAVRKYYARKSLPQKPEREASHTNASTH